MQILFQCQLMNHFSHKPRQFYPNVNIIHFIYTCPCIWKELFWILKKTRTHPQVRMFKRACLRVLKMEQTFELLLDPLLLLVHQKGDWKLSIKEIELFTSHIYSLTQLMHKTKTKCRKHTNLHSSVNVTNIYGQREFFILIFLQAKYLIYSTRKLKITCIIKYITAPRPDRSILTKNCTN